MSLIYNISESAINCVLWGNTWAQEHGMYLSDPDLTFWEMKSPTLGAKDIRRGLSDPWMEDESGYRRKIDVRMASGLLGSGSNVSMTHTLGGYGKLSLQCKSRNRMKCGSRAPFQLSVHPSADSGILLWIPRRFTPRGVCSSKPAVFSEFRWTYRLYSVMSKSLSRLRDVVERCWKVLYCLRLTGSRVSVLLGESRYKLLLRFFWDSWLRRIASESEVQDASVSPYKDVGATIWPSVRQHCKRKWISSLCRR